MTPTTLSVPVITILLLGTVSMTDSHPVALSLQESVQTLKKSLPKTVYSQETAQQSMLNIKPVPEMVYGRDSAQKSVQNVKPVSPMMYAQEATLQNDIMAHATVDECSQVYNFCRNSGEYNWFFCVGLLVDCRIHPVQQ